MADTTVSVRLTNRWAHFGYYPEEVAVAFSYFAPNYYWSPKYRQGVWDGRIRLIRYKRLASGVFLALRKQVESELGITFVVTDERKKPKFNTKGVTSDRQYQIDCLNTLIKCSNCGGVVLCATGTGKTRIAGMYFKALQGEGVFVVDELTLLQQAKADLEKVLGEEVGIIGDRQFYPRRITVATAQTLHRHRKDKDYFQWQSKQEAMFIDEVHQQINRRAIETVKRIQPKALFGLTATLRMARKDIRFRVYELTGPIIFNYSLVTGVKERVLTPGVVAAVDLVRKLRTTYGYQDMYERYVLNSRKRNDFIEALVREGVRRKKYIIVLVERKAHVRKFAKRLSDLPIGLAYGPIAVEERVRAKNRFEKGKLRVLIANKVFKKGVSINRISVIIDAGAMKSRNDAVQKYGRGVRLCDGKQGLIYFDVGDRRPDGQSDSLVRATKSRRSGLREVGITVVPVKDHSIRKIYDRAEVALNRVIRKQEKEGAR